MSQDDTKYRDYFDEILPYSSGPMKHRYTVEIVRAVFNKKAFEVFCRYEASIHKKEDKSKKGYENFLCQSPLFDHTSKSSDNTFGPWEDHIDDNRKS